MLPLDGAHRDTRTRSRAHTHTHTHRDKHTLTNSQTQTQTHIHYLCEPVMRDHREQMLLFLFLLLCLRFRGCPSRALVSSVATIYHIVAARGPGSDRAGSQASCLRPQPHKHHLALHRRKQQHPVGSLHKEIFFLIN